MNINKWLDYHNENNLFTGDILPLINNAVLFDAGNIALIPKINKTTNITEIKPPYPITVTEFQFDKNEDISAMLIIFLYDYESRNTRFTISTKDKHTNIWANSHFMDVFFNDDGLPVFKKLSDPSEEATMMYAFAMALSFFDVINCSNVTLIDNEPSKLKQSRVKKGKTPLFTYKTLHIKTSYTKGKNKGEGKHASPRVHLRRGHIRTLNSGLTTWVQPCVVGDKSKGMVHKDYAVCSDV